MTDIKAGQFFDQLSTISTALNLGLIQDSNPEFRNLVEEIVAETFVDWYREMSYSEFKLELRTKSWKCLNTWALVDLIDDLIDYYWNSFNDEDTFDPESDLKLLAEIVNTMYSPIEWTKINKGIIETQQKQQNNG